jgi:uncharacterized membrane protein (UPF0127 family)
MNSRKNTAALASCLLFVFAANAAIACSEKLPVRELAFERNGFTLATIKAETAVTPEERSRGLMERKKLNDGEGMIFIFERNEILSFWMKNTFIPLSIAFIAQDGRIIDIKDMQPLDLSSVVSSRAVRYALEVPQGWFSRAGIRTGDIVTGITD